MGLARVQLLPFQVQVPERAVPDAAVPEACPAGVLEPPKRTTRC